MKKDILNPVYDWDEDDAIGFVLGDPELPDDLRRGLYELGCKLYGEIDGGFEGIEILSIEETNQEYEKLRREFDPIIRGKSRAQKIFDFLMVSEGDDVYTNLENLNDFLADKPINAYVLSKLMALIVEQEFKVKASLASKIRHIETYEIKKQAIEYWRKHINPTLSNPKAADLLIKVVPVSHRKLVEYVAEAKRENIPPAS